MCAQRVREKKEPKGASSKRKGLRKRNGNEAETDAGGFFAGGKIENSVCKKNWWLGKQALLQQSASTSCWHKLGRLFSSCLLCQPLKPALLGLWPDTGTKLKLCGEKSQ